MTNPWDQRYSQSDFYYGTTPNTFLKEYSNLLPMAADVLCLGDGEGRNSVFLAQSHHRVTALDLSEVGLKKMQKFAELNQVKVSSLHADLSVYQFEESAWDSIVSIWCHIPSLLRFRVHQAVQKSLKVGGFFILEAYTPEQLKYKTGGPPDVDLLVTLKELSHQFSNFRIVVGQELVREVQEGQGHSGASAVVQFIAQRIN